MASPLTGLAGLPPILPQVPGTPGPPASTPPLAGHPFGALGAILGAPDAAPPAASQAPAGAADTGGSLFSVAGWQNLLHGLLQDAEVYGFLFLLVGVGLYGLFAPQVNTVIQTAGKAAAVA